MANACRRVECLVRNSLKTLGENDDLACEEAERTCCNGLNACGNGEDHAALNVCCTGRTSDEGHTVLRKKCTVNGLKSGVIVANYEFFKCKALLVHIDDSRYVLDLSINGDLLKTHTSVECSFTKDSNGCGEGEFFKSALCKCLLANLNNVVALEDDRLKVAASCECVLTDSGYACGNAERSEVCTVKCVVGNYGVG